MAGFQGTATTFQFETGVPLDFRPFVDLLDPIELTAQNMYGSRGFSAFAQDTSEQIKIEWQSEQLLLPSSQLALAPLAGDTTITVRRVADGESYDHKLKFQTGSVLKINDEHLRVTGYGAGAGELTVARGFAGTTAAGHAVGALVREVGHALPEGSDPQERRALDRDSDFNFHQIFGPVGVKVSRSRQAVTRFGVANEMTKQTDNRLVELAHSVEQAIWYGVRFEDAANERRTMGGVFYYISQHVDTTAVDLATGPAAVENMVESLYVAGNRDRQYYFYANPTQLRKINGWDAGQVQLGRQDNGRGQVVTYLDTEYGRVDFIPSDHINASDAAVVGESQLTIETLPGRDYQFIPEGIDGDYWEGFVVCEKSLEFVRPEHAGAFTNLQ